MQVFEWRMLGSMMSGKPPQILGLVLIRSGIELLEMTRVGDVHQGRLVDGIARHNPQT